MIYFTLIVIVVNPVQQPAPVVQEQPIVQKWPSEGMTYHCPNCSWWNSYDNMKAFKIGTKQHQKRCKGHKKLFG